MCVLRLCAIRTSTWLRKFPLRSCVTRRTRLQKKSDTEIRSYCFSPFWFCVDYHFEIGTLQSDKRYKKATQLINQTAERRESPCNLTRGSDDNRGPCSIPYAASVAHCHLWPHPVTDGTYLLNRILIACTSSSSSSSAGACRSLLHANVHPLSRCFSPRTSRSSQRRQPRRRYASSFSSFGSFRSSSFSAIPPVYLARCIATKRVL